MSKQIVEILTNGFDPDVRVYKEAVYLVSKGYKVTILCWDRDKRDDYPAEEIVDGIKIVRFRILSELGSGKKQIFAYLKFVRKCKQYLKCHEYDYLHCNDIDGQIAGCLIKKRKKPIVFDMHEYYEDQGDDASKIIIKFWRKLTIYLIKKSIAALYENDLYLEKPYTKIHNKLYELKNYPSSNLITAKEKTPSDFFRIGYIGSLRGQIPEFTTLFEAVKGMEDVIVDVYGKGVDYLKLCELGEKYKNVRVHGKFNGTTELMELYSNVDVGFMGYRTWSTSREYDELVKFFENVFTGTPIILTGAYTKMANRVNACGYGITCDTLDVEQVRKCILRLKNDKEFWKQCHQNELQDAHLYDWDKAVKVLDNIYQ